jgi:hypothetical protein
MLEIRINSDVFDLPEDIQVPIVASNPLVSETGFNEIFTYSFSLKASPRNIAIYNKYFQKSPKITLSFQSHKITTGVAKMKRDSSGISIMIKNEGLDLRQSLENIGFDQIELETIQVYDSEDTPEEKIQAWNNFMNATLPQNQDVNVGDFKFPPIEAFPREEWKISGENGSAINKGMDLNQWCVNRYQLSDGLYAKNIQMSKGKREVTYMVFGDSSSIDGGEYFTINSANNVEKFYVWYQKVPAGGGSPIGTDPIIAGRTGIRVALPWPDISAPDEVRNYTIDAILGATYNNLQDFESKHFDFVGISGMPYNAIFIVNKIAGQTENSTLGDLPTPPWAMSTFRNGTGLIADSNNNWITTISPALRISFLFKEITKKLNLKVNYSAVEEIPEFEQLLYFSGKVLDERIDVDATLLADEFDYQFNVHGQYLNLNDFKPTNKAIDIFKTLRTIFGISFDLVNNKLTIQRIAINTKSADLSKFCLPDYTYEELDSKALLFGYGLGEESWKYLDFINGFATDKFQDKTIGISTNDPVIEEVNYLPMISQNSKPTTLHVPFLAKSKAYNENDWIASETLNVGLYRGNYLIDFTIGSDGINPPAEFTEERLICYNSNSIEPNNVQYFGEFINYVGAFGTASIYFNDEDSHLDVYAKFMNLVKIYNRQIEKNLNLPFQNILEIMKWKQPIHTIQQRNMSFVGIVKELKFTLSKSNVSPVTITYLSNKKVGSGDFNSDFNVDFNS